MKCPNPIDYFLVHHMLTLAQVALWIAVWELEKWLWRLARGRSPLTSDPDKISSTRDEAED